jgi:hypothetical protein
MTPTAVRPKRVCLSKNSVYYDQHVCHVYERFEDSAAAITHLESFAANFAERFAKVGKPTLLVVYGTPSAQVKDALAG